MLIPVFLSNISLISNNFSWGVNWLPDALTIFVFIILSPSINPLSLKLSIWVLLTTRLIPRPVKSALRPINLNGDSITLAIAVSIISTGFKAISAPRNAARATGAAAPNWLACVPIGISTFFVTGLKSPTLTTLFVPFGTPNFAASSSGNISKYRFLTGSIVVCWIVFVVARPAELSVCPLRTASKLALATLAGGKAIQGASSANPRVYGGNLYKSSSSCLCSTWVAGLWLACSNRWISFWTFWLLFVSGSNISKSLFKFSPITSNPTFKGLKFCNWSANAAGENLPSGVTYWSKLKLISPLPNWPGMSYHGTSGAPGVSSNLIGTGSKNLLTVGITARFCISPNPWNTCLITGKFTAVSNPGCKKSLQTLDKNPSSCGDWEP